MPIDAGIDAGIYADRCIGMDASFPNVAFPVARISLDSDKSKVVS
jgi:hypothetical protein